MSPRRTLGRRRRAGMTLLELLVGLVVTSLMAGAGYGAFAGLIDARERARAAAREVERSAALRETLYGWLAAGDVLVERGSPAGGAGGGRGRGSEGQTSAHEAGDALTVNTAAPTPAESPTAVLRLFADDDPATPEQGLTVRYRPRPTDSLQVRELEPRVRALRVEYLDRRTGRWVAAADAPAAEPAAVRLTLLGMPTEPLPAVLTLPFVRALGDPADARVTP